MDASILLTANVPSAKKIIVHGPQGPEEGGIPSQFPIGEDVQFCQILREALDFFGIEEDVMREYFLVDHKTRKLARFTEQIFILLFSVHSRWQSGRHHRLKPRCHIIYKKLLDRGSGKKVSMAPKLSRT